MCVCIYIYIYIFVPFLSLFHHQIIIMMSLCKKSVHSFLDLTNTMDDNYNSNLSSSCNKHAGAGDDDACRPTSSCNVIESSVFSKLLPSPTPAITTTTTSPLFYSPSVFSKKDPGGIGFIDDMGGGIDGLMSCTESLGFESSDERTVDDHQMEEMTNQYSSKARWRKDYHHGSGGSGERKEVKKFPPPLSSFNRNGQPSFYLRSVRTDGRLELTEVRIDRPEILRASREDGRLRLHLIREDDEVEEEEEEETLKEELQDEETLEEEGEEEKDEEEEGRVGEWKLEGFRRCNEMMGHHQNMTCHHHHSHLHVWSRHCVPTR